MTQYYPTTPYRLRPSAHPEAEGERAIKATRWLGGRVASVSSLRQDTHPAQLAEYQRLLRQLTPAQRLHLMSVNSRRVRTMVEAGVRMRHPEATHQERHAWVVRKLYGAEVATRLVGVDEMKPSQDEIEDVAVRVARVLQQLGIRYLIGGSVASSLLGEPRATNDIDILVDLSEGQISELIAGLGPDFSVDEEALLEAVRTRRSWNIFYLPLVTKVDLFIKRTDPFDDSELARRRFVPIGEKGDGLFVASPEDIVLRKLAWYRAGDEVADSQWRDVLGVLATSGAELDQGYLTEWAAKLGVTDLLARALSEQPPPGSSDA